MAVPTAYTTTSLAVYLKYVPGDIIDVLGWNTDSPQVQEAVNDALLEYGVTDAATITGIDELRRLRALGRRAIWRAIVQATANWYSITDNGQKLERQQVHAQALTAYEQADNDCRAAGADPALAVNVIHVQRVRDPYAVIPDAERL
jgi:sulfite reductase alpha subunit-like flavoprotein